MVRRQKNRGVAGRQATGWNWRLGGLGLVAFFALGYFSGVRTPRNALVRRAIDACDQYRTRLRQDAAMVLKLPNPAAEHAEPRETAAGAVAMVERRDGFYTMLASGELRGPVSANAEDNLPIISGAALENARAENLVDYAGILVRAEAKLSELISEMRLQPDGEVSLFLDRSRTEIVLDLDRAALELDRAAMVLRAWRGREAEIAVLDMAVPGQAVMRLRPAAAAGAKRPNKAKGGSSGDPGKIVKASVAEAGWR